MIGKQQEYDVMAKCEKELWWYQSLHKLTIKKISRYSRIQNPSILDAGCGTGGMLVRFQESGYTELTGFDLSFDAVSYTQSKTGIPVQQLNLNDVAQHYGRNSFDIITSLDTLTLIEEGADESVVSQLLSLLKPGGVLIINVAAIKYFRGSHDVVLHMKRRYTKKSIRKIIKEKAVIKEMTYWPFLLAPLIFAIRLYQRAITKIKPLAITVSDVKPIHSVFNKFFSRLTQWENEALPWKPWGSSLFVVLQKPL
jgi:2-polyprenyl-3-methyl-5-hydroxy-6-metoxy-1,4-benzoquinol methylase